MHRSHLLRWRHTTAQVNYDRQRETACAAPLRDWAERCRPARPSARLQVPSTSRWFPNRTTPQGRCRSTSRPASASIDQVDKRGTLGSGRRQLSPPSSLVNKPKFSVPAMTRRGFVGSTCKQLIEKNVSPFPSVSTRHRAARSDTTPIASPDAKSCPSPPISTPSTPRGVHRERFCRQASMRKSNRLLGSRKDFSLRSK